jgi:hypothetical protein
VTTIRQSVRGLGPDGLNCEAGRSSLASMQRSTSIVLHAPAQQIWDYIQDNATALDPAILAFHVQLLPALEL